MKITPTQGLDCKAAYIRDAADPFGGSIDESGVRIDVQGVDAQCQVTLQVQPGSGGDPFSTTMLGGMIALDLENGRGTALPLQIGVFQATDCTMVQDDCYPTSLVTAQTQFGDCASKWGIQTSIPSLDSPMGEKSPSLTDDELEIFFERGGHIHTATRAQPTDPWSNVTEVPGLSILNITDATPHVLPDGLTLYFSSNRQTGATGALDIYVLHRSDRNSAWSLPPTLVSSLSNATFSETGASTDETQTHLIFAANNAGYYRLFESTRPDTNTTWGPPGAVFLPDANAYDDMNPFLSPDGLTLWFQSNRPPPGGGASGMEIYVMRRDSVDDSFDGEPQRVGPPISSIGEDQDAWVSRDHSTLYYATSAPAGVFHIYSIKR
jgi:hypothetical protein